jgi:adenosylhomocysteine nucleosidase
MNLPLLAGDRFIPSKPKHSGRGAGGQLSSRLAAEGPRRSRGLWGAARRPVFIGRCGGCTLVRYNPAVPENHPLIILTAVMTEARAVAEALGIRCPAVGKPTRADRPRPLELHVIGIGGRHFSGGLDHAAGILLAGLAGGLDPGLRVGEVIVDGRADPIPPAKPGRIVCSRLLVATPAQKAELFRQTGAAAVDMESDAVRRAAGNVPIVHLRAISDAAGDSIDPAILKWVDSVGRPSGGRLAMGLLKRPMLAAELVRLARHVRIATRALAVAVPGAVAEW